MPILFNIFKQTQKRAKAPGHEEHRLGRVSFHDVILGGQDGLVNVLGVILGVAAASGDSRIVIAAGLAATFAESISMAAVAYTSEKAEHEHYLAELEREKEEIEMMPEEETEEVREIYAQKDFKGKILDQVVEHITKDKNVWLKVMMLEELGLQETDQRKILKGALIVGGSAVIGSLIPLFPFFFLSVKTSISWSLIISALVLFVFGAYKAKITIGYWLRSGLEMTTIGIVSALAGYLIGLLFNLAVR